jgi:Cysteine-rich CPXCG
MSGIAECNVECPYCGETIGVLIDCSVAEQRYIEDCQVCCRPIEFDVVVTIEGDVDIRVSTDNE